jgi:hypothetical protein
MKKPLLVVILLLVALATCGIGLLLVRGALTPPAPNVRDQAVGNIILSGRLEEGGVQYDILKIGTLDDPYAGEPPIEMRFDRERLVRFASDSADDLEAKSIDVLGIGTTRWPDATKCVFARGVYAAVLDGRIVHVSIVDLGEITLEVRTPRVDDWRSIPLSQEDADSLFGPPDRVIEYYDPTEP